ncbi:MULTISPECIES: hypothetical protein [Marivita]|uniref:Uncharacterized protein n=2 Tax=Marivita cryptomonadis TaxID=505252 RepID=A0A9Q2P1H7_9RHOB|nr:MULTISPECIES: hypothetical protein [Marivita]MCR9167924.1 hypothetical protein [Paracoccaceae bacterium]MBM2322703.1 hypothetical protein [Marivita cryptomonadis]MBM2332285.1 hypothetical protein [Marivita cryptomonadis]MBM2341869.1 hypothetical protein [Marivita cryptomonadis]MBM2346533.1 hypothetical protein [Marivita cryptomonadis]
MTTDVTVISMVTNKTRDAICQSVVPAIHAALQNQRIDFQRQPVTRDYIDWVVNDMDTLTLAIDEVGNSSVIMLASRGTEARAAAARLANVAAELCRDFDAHTVFWNGSTTPVAVADFLAAGDTIADDGFAKARIVPRKVSANARMRSTRRRKATQMDNWMMTAVRAQMNGVTLEEIERMELEERRAKSAQMRLSAWAISFTTALIAAPLAIPLIVHNLVRGEDVRSGAMALGVAGLYAVLAQTGMAPSLPQIL